MSDITTLMMAASGVGGEEPTGYQISRSLRFNSADSAYLSRTPASAGNRKTWTWSGWVKRSGLGTYLTVFDGGSTGPLCSLGFMNTDKIRMYFSNSAVSAAESFVTDAVFRDVSAWYHIIFVLDTTQATLADRAKVYVNGVLQSGTGLTGTYLTQNSDQGVNRAVQHTLGAYQYSGLQEYFNGYLTEINFVDGQALTPSDFGETDETTGVWKPKEYTGTYGTTGFYINFSDNTSTTTLGEDQAGSNDWTLNNFSVAAGANNDSLVDTPTPYGTDTGAGGEVRGNYCTLNPLATVSDTLSNGALDWVSGLAANRITKSSFGVTTGKWYAEFTYTGTNNGTIVGICAVNSNASGGVPTEGAYAYTPSGNKYVISASSAYGATWTTNDVIGIALDLDADEITFYKNNASQGAISITVAGPFAFFCIGSNTNDKGTWNFGQRPFAYTAPSGFKALCTQNLPEPTIADGSEYFNTVLYTGTGSAQSITGVGFQPDWVWIKERSGAADHGLYDAVRGTTKQLESNTTTAETTEATGLTAFGSDGFTVGALAQLNTNTDTYVAWNWNAGGSNATNTDGTITSTVRANTTAGFSIVTATTPASGTFTVGHGLGVAPSMFIIKGRETAGYTWNVYHKSLGAGGLLVLNSAAAFAANTGVWQNTAPSTSVIYGNSTNWGGSEDYVIYAFAEIEGYSKFGRYTGNGSTNGPFVYTGFRPAWFVVKQTSGGGGFWHLIDSTRGTYNPLQLGLYPNSSNAESPTNASDILSNGLKIRNTQGEINGSGSTYIFAAFAENPFKYSLAR